MQDVNWKRELTIASTFVGGAFLLIPIAIYFVGQSLFDSYAGGSVLALMEKVWGDFLTLRPVTWILVLSPYLTVLLARALWRLWWPKKV